MEINEILAHVDHTLLAQTATWDEIRQICDDGITYHTASVCIPPSYVKQASDYVNGKTAVCTVIGFPNGYMTTAAKEFETKDAIANGAAGGISSLEDAEKFLARGADRLGTSRIVKIVKDINR